MPFNYSTAAAGRCIDYSYAITASIALLLLLAIGLCYTYYIYHVPIN